MKVLYDAPLCSDGSGHPDSWVEPGGWSGNLRSKSTSIHLAKPRLRRKPTIRAVDLHEFAHAHQLYQYLSEKMYKKHVLFVEAEAGAIAVIWLAPEHIAAAVSGRLDALDSYCQTYHIEPPPSFTSLAAYFKHHIRRIERQWQAHAESKCNVPGLMTL